MSGTAMGSITELLERTKLSDLCKSNQKVVLLEHNLTIGDALKARGDWQGPDHHGLRLFVGGLTRPPPPPAEAG